MARFALLLLFTFAGTPWLGAQTPVPQGEATAAATLSGTVQGPTGDALDATKISVKRAQSSEELSVAANTHGEFRVSLRPGQYTVSAVAPGFASFSRELSVSANQAVTIQVTLEKQAVVPAGERSSVDCGAVNPGGSGDRKPGQVSGAPCRIGGASVPDGDLHSSVAGVGHSAPHGGTAPGSVLPGDVPIPASGAVAVSGTFANQVDLAAWLNGQSARNLRVQAIISSAQGNENLFVWIAHSGTDQHFVVSANQISNPDDLQNVLKAYPQASVVGLARVQHDRYLVLRSNP